MEAKLNLTTTDELLNPTNATVSPLETGPAYNFKVGPGSIVRACETDGEWCRCRVEATGPWGVLVREIPSGGGESKGTQFAASWSRVEVVPGWIEPQVEPGESDAGVGESTQVGMRFSIKVGDEIEGTDGLDGDYIRGRILSVTRDGVFLESTEDGTKGQVFGSTWDGLVHHPDPATGVPGDDTATNTTEDSLASTPTTCAVPVQVGHEVWADIEERGVSTLCEVTEVLPTHVEVLDNGEYHVVGWTDIKLNAIGAAAVTREMISRAKVPF